MKRIRLRAFLASTIVLLLTLMMPILNASETSEERTLVVHYTRFDSTKTQWGLFLHGVEPYYTNLNEYYFDHSDENFSVATIKLDDTNLSESTRIVVYLYNRDWISDVTYARDFYLDDFNDEGVMNIYLVQSVSNIFHTAEDALIERDKFVIESGIEYRIEDGTATLWRPNWNMANNTSREVLQIPASVTKDDVQYDVTKIASRAFSNYYFQGVIELPSTLVEIESYAFQNTSFNYFILPSGLETIGDYAFANNNQLYEVFIPSTVSSIKPHAFSFLPSGATIFIESTEVPESWAFNWKSEDIKLVTGYDQLPKFVSVDEFDYLIYSGIAKILGFNNIPTGDLMLNIPNEVNVEIDGELLNLPVKKIGARAFHNLQNVISIYIPANIVEVEFAAFNFNLNARSLTFDEDSQLEYIRENAFSTLINLNDLQLPLSTKFIGAYAFRNISFYGNIDLITIPNNVQYVGYGAFESYNESSVIILLESDEHIGSWDYYWNSSNHLYFIEEAPIIASVGNYKFLIDEETMSANLFRMLRTDNINQTLILPNTVTLNDVLYQVTSISSDLLSQAWNVRNIQLPENLETISSTALSRPYQLESITISSSNPFFTTLDGVLYNKDKTNLIFYPRAKTTGVFNIPSTVIEIENQAFHGARFLKVINFDENSSLRTIGSSAFFNTSLRYVDLPDGLETIKEYAFANIHSLSVAKIPASVTDVRYYAFGASETTIFLSQSTIPESWHSSWDGGHSLNIVYDYQEALKIFSRNNLLYLVIDDEATLLGYENSPLSDQNLVVPETITLNEGQGSIPVRYIGVNAFRLEDRIVSVLISKNVREIRANAFYQNYNLRKIEFASNSELKNIDSMAFFYAYQVRELILPDGIETIGQYAFSHNESLRMVYLPASVLYVDYYAFHNWQTNSLLIIVDEDADISNWHPEWNVNNNEIIRGSAFEIVDQGDFTYWLTPDYSATIIDFNNYYESHVSIPETISVNGVTYSVTAIRGEIFKNSYRVQTIQIPASITEISNTTLRNMHSLSAIEVAIENPKFSSEAGVLYNSGKTELISYPRLKQGKVFDLPSTVEIIRDYAFYQNHNLETINFVNSNLITIQRGAFEYSNLRYVSLPSSLETIRSNAFGSMRNLSLLYIPKSVNILENNSISSWNTSIEIYVEAEAVDIDDLWESNWRGSNTQVFYGTSQAVKIENVNNLRYILVGQSARVLGYSQSPTEFVSLTIPETVTVDGNTYNVTRIQAAAFEREHYIQSVTFPSTLKTIGRAAFHSTHSLETINFAENGDLTRIENEAFWNAGQLKNIYLPWGLEHVGDYAFAYIWNLRTFSVPETVNYMGEGVLYTWGTKSVAVIVANENQVNSWFRNWNPNDYPVYYGDSLLIHDDGTLTYWVIEGKASLMGFTSQNVNNRLQIPSKIVVNDNEYNIEIIGMNAFAGDNNLTTIIIPNTIKEIKAGAFQDIWRLEEVVFAQNSQLELIGERAFANIGVREITIPKSVKDIGDEAFIYTRNLFNIEFEVDSQLETIGRQVFAWGVRNTTLSLPQTLTTIADGAFSNMSNLTQISINSSNPNFTTIDGVLYTSDFSKLISYPAAKLDKSFSVPMEVEIIANSAFRGTLFLENVDFEVDSNLTEIGEYAFESSSIRNIILPNKLNTIRQYAFINVQRLNYINIPQSVQNIAYHAFGGRINIFVESTNIPTGWNFNWNLGHGTVYIGQKMEIHEENNLKFMIVGDEATFIGVNDAYTSTHLTIPKTVNDGVIVRYVGTASLYENQSITKITIPETVTIIQSYAFVRMNNLITVDFAGTSQLHTIEQYAFSQTGMIDFKIPRSVVEIHEYAFAWNEHLLLITIPHSVETIRYYAFVGGRQQMLVLAEVDEAPDGWDSNWFGWQSKNVVFGSSLDIVVEDYLQYVITNSGNAKVIGILADHPSVINIPDVIYVATIERKVTSILTSAFENNNNLTEITIGKNISTIGDRAFNRASNLRKVEISSGSVLESIGEQAFRQTGIRSFTLPNTVKRIEAQAFESAWSMTTFDIDSSSQLNFIGYGAFRWNHSMTSFDLPDSVERIEGFTFESNHSMTSFNINPTSSLEFIGHGAFRWNYSLTSFYIPSGVKEIETNPFRGTNNLTEFVIDPSNSIYSINGPMIIETTNSENRLIIYLAALGDTSLIIPNNINTIASDVFSESWNLESITFESGSQLKRIEAYAFMSSRFKTLRLPDSLEYIGPYAFAYNWELNSVFIPTGVIQVQYYAFFSGNPGMVIYINDESQVSTWSYGWNGDNKFVIFGNTILHSQDGFEYRIEGDEAILIGLSIGADTETSYIIPSQVDFESGILPVVEISANVFSRNYHINTISIPHSIRRISAGAFNQTYNLNQVNFLKDSGISHLEYIGTGAFMNTGIRELIIPSSVQIIEPQAFQGNWQLETVIFESGIRLEQIEHDVFSWNGSLRSIEIPASVILIKSDAFRGTYALESFIVSSGNTNYSSDNGVLFNFEKTRLISYPIGRDQDTYLVPKGVVQIEDHAFNGVHRLRVIEFEEGSRLLRIGRNAFSSTSIRTISLPDGLMEIDSYAFAWNHQLLLVSVPSTVVSMQNDVFRGGSSDMIIFLESSNVLQSWSPWWNSDNKMVVFDSFINIINQGSLRYVVANDEAVVFGLNTGVVDLVIPSFITHNENEIPIRRISTSAFENDNLLEKITIPDTLISIDSRAFRNASQLKSVVFSGTSHLETIGEEAFMNTALSSFILPSTVREIGVFSFASIYSMTSFNFEENSQIKVIPRFAFAWNGLQSVLIPSGVTHIEEHAFHNAYRLASLEISSGSNLKSIGQYAFAWIYNLETVWLPASLELIDESAFRGSHMINNYVVESGNTKLSSENGVLFNNNKTHLIAYPPAKVGTSYEIPQSVTIIKADAFSFARNLETITLSDSLKRIERNAFMYTSLKSVTIPSGVTQIEDYAFFGNWNMTSISIPKTVNRIGFNAIRYLGRNAIIRFEGDSIPSTWSSQWNPDGINTVLGSETLIEEGNFVYTIGFGDNPVVTLIGLSASGLSEHSIEIPERLQDGKLITEIGVAAFMDSDIQSVTIPKSVTIIRNSAFKNTFMLTNVEFSSGSNLSIIGREAFANSSIENIIIPASVNVIRERAFENAYELQSVVFETDSNLERIESLAFSWNPIIQSYDLPNNLSFIAMDAFLSNKSLTAINISNEFYSSTSGVLYGEEEKILIQYPAAKEDSTFILPETVKVIAPFAFRDSNILSITLSEGLESIGAYAFLDSSGLSSIVIPSTVIFVGESAFAQTSLRLEDITLSNGINQDLWNTDWNKGLIG